MNHEETYKCPKCGCEFENREGEKNMCRCTERSTAIKGDKASQQEQPGKESDQSCPCCR